MLNVIFTLDYEIHGNGQGSAYHLMVEPTERLLGLFNRYGAKLTIFADIAEILKFKEYKDKYGRDDYCYDEIVKQLQHAVETGHDVQLHIHSSYFNANYKNGQWCQDWNEYNFANLPYERICWMVRTGKMFLESLLKPIDQRYKCVAFRAANWAVNPSKNVAQALMDNDINIDTSIFKYGQRNGLASFDYSSAHHKFIPWPADMNNLCRYKPNSSLWEFPIYSENRLIFSFLTINRIYRTILGSMHKVPKKIKTEKKGESSLNRKWMNGAIFKKHAWKADFNQCSGGQLIRALIRAEKFVPKSEIIPFTLIGHSKIFTKRNERTIKPFLRFIGKHSERFRFATFSKLRGKANLIEGLY